MLKIGDKVVITWDPWTYPITVEKEVVSQETFDNATICEKMTLMTLNDALAERINMKQNPAYPRIGKKVYSFKWKIKKKNMSEISKSMKTEELQKLIDRGARLVFKIPDYRGGTFNWCLEKDHEKMLVDGKYFNDLRIAKGDSIYKNLTRPISEWTDREKMINQDMRSMLRMDSPPVPFNNTIGEYFTEIRVNEQNDSEPVEEKIVPKKFPRKIKKRFTKNIKHIEELQKRVHNVHKPKCAKLRSPSTRNLPEWKVQGKFDGERTIHSIKAKTCEAAYNEMVYMEYTDVMVLSGTPAKPKRRSSTRRRKKRLKQDDSQLHAHLRMVCIKHITGEVQRLPQWKAELKVNKEKDYWEFCDKQEWRRWVNSTAYLRKAEPKSGIHKSPAFGKAFTRRDGTRVRKIKGVPGTPPYRKKVLKVRKTRAEFLDDTKRRYEKKLKMNRERRQRNANRLEHKLYKKCPHLTTKDKIKLDRMLKIKPNDKNKK